MDNIDEWLRRSESRAAGRAESLPKERTSELQRAEPKRSEGSSNSNSKPQPQQKTSFNKKRKFKKFHKRQEKSAKPGENRQAKPGENHGPRHRFQMRPASHSVHKALPKTRPSKPTQILQGKLKIIPLGGLNEVGKNMMALEYENDIIIIDMGFEFPSEDLLGIDYVIPDVTYLEDNKKRIRGVLITHGHLDHIGGIPYILPKLDFPPIFATKLTIGLVQKRIEEFKQERMAKLNVIEPGKRFRLGTFVIDFFRVAHSIPDATGIIIDTPVGKIVHTGDFKFDETPARNQLPADTKKMEELGRQNVLALFCESTNALKPGHSISEQQVGRILDEIIGTSKGRVIVASFSSQIGRVQQVIDAAAKHKRKVFVSGKSMRDNIEISHKLGYLTVERDVIKDVKRYKDVPDEQTLILTTGSQGEEVSALTRMANNEHAHVKVQKGDTIILSSSPIPGNERAIHTVINSLTMLGADVINNQMMDVHTSGHGNEDELMRMINYVKPRYLVPIHGEFYMRKGLAKLGQKRCNIPEERILMLQNGDVLIAERGGRLSVAKEKIDTKYILIDGTGEGQVGSQVQFDREIMSQNGALVVLIYITRKTQKISRDPDVISRGFIYMHESDEITAEISKMAVGAYKNIQEKNPGANRKDIKKYIRQTLDKLTHQKLERRPLIVPLIIEI